MSSQPLEKRSTRRPDGKVPFSVFFLMWANIVGWKVPPFHMAICHFLEYRGEDAVLMVFRGAAKSSILAVYNAWLFYCDPTELILHQGDQDKTAFKTSRDTRDIIRRHPLCEDLRVGLRGSPDFWWVGGHEDERNPSMQAVGITTSITSSRATEIQNDDIEVPKNIATETAREKLRHKLSEQNFIAVPGTYVLWVGTPHTRHSIYDEQIEAGADVLKIPLFHKEQRLNCDGTTNRFSIKFKPDTVFLGINNESALLVEGEHYRIEDNEILFAEPPVATVDIYYGNAWPERFTPEDLLRRRKRCKTFNYWDSQYQLHSRPVSDIRLNPDKMPLYDCEPMIGLANRKVVMYLGNAQIAGITAVWDVASGKLTSDKSVLGILLQDVHGVRYWHRSQQLIGDLVTYAGDGKTIIGGQVWQIANLVEELNVPRVTILDRGIGYFTPTTLRACFTQRSIRCAVVTETETKNKNQKILGQIEGPLDAGKLWCHVDVIDIIEDQMETWNPKETDQLDDDLDTLAECIKAQPERVAIVGPAHESQHNSEWQPTGGSYEIQSDY